MPPRAPVLAALPLTLALAAALNAHAEPIYSNGSPDPALPALPGSVTSHSGVRAPAGLRWSEPGAAGGEANAVAGFAAHALGPASPFRFADDFTVPAGSNWRVSEVWVFAYQPDYAAAAPPILAATLRLWSGEPDTPGARPLAGDRDASALIACTPTDLLRIFRSNAAPAPATPDAARRIWRVRLQVPETHLGPGTYWLDWQFSDVAGSGEAFGLPASLPAARTLPQWNARQLRTSVVGGAWVPLLDRGKPDTAPDLPQDLAFVLLGEVLPTCGLADVVSIGGFPPPDGQLTVDDYTSFINAFAADDGLADIVAVGGFPPADGLITVADYTSFINAFAEGCG